MATRATIERWKRRLRSDFPSRFPVRIVLVPEGQLKSGSSDVHGITLFYEDPPRCVIHLEDHSDDAIVRDTLLHEWSHCLRYHIPYGEMGSDHDEVFAAIYGCIYRAFMG